MTQKHDLILQNYKNNQKTQTIKFLLKLQIQQYRIKLKFYINFLKAEI